MNALLTDIACRIFGILKRKRREKKSVKVFDEMTLGEIKQLQKDYEKDLKETLLHYIKTHPHCSEIIIVKPYFPADVFICNQEDVEQLDCRVKLNSTV